MNTNALTKVGVALAAIFLMVSAVATPAAAASTLNYDDGQAPNPQFSTDVTVDSWDNGEFNSPLEYYDDSGDAADLGGEVNRSSDVDDLGTGTVNPISLTATDINVAEFGQFPRKDEGDNAASFLDASEWTTSGASTSEVTTAPNVEAIQYAGSATSDYATYSNFSISSSAEKRYLQIAADVTSASGTPELRVEDQDGDYVAVELYNSSASQSADGVLANQTGEGHVTQVQVGSLTVEGSGDGTITDIAAVNVTGDATVDFSLVNVERTSPYTFGEKYVQTDDDEELETETIREPHGEYSVHSVDTLGAMFDDAVVKGLSFPAHVEAAMLPAEDVDATFKGDNAYPQWDSVADIYYRMTLPDAYDLSYSNVQLEQTSEWPGTRYVSVEMVEGAGDTAFEDIESWTAFTSSFDAQDKDITLDSTVSPGTEYALHYEIKLTGDEASAMQSAGGPGVMKGDGGGFFSMLFSPIGAIASALTGLVGGRKLGVI